MEKNQYFTSILLFALYDTKGEIICKLIGKISRLLIISQISIFLLFDLWAKSYQLIISQVKILSYWLSNKLKPIVFLYDNLFLLLTFKWFRPKNLLYISALTFKDSSVLFSIQTLKCSCYILFYVNAPFPSAEHS